MKFKIWVCLGFFNNNILNIRARVTLNMELTLDSLSIIPQSQYVLQGIMGQN